MKKQIIYSIALLCLLFTGACSKDAAVEGTGTMTMTITASRPEVSPSDAYDVMDHLQVTLYNSTGERLRVYSSVADIPARLELMAGDYRLAVEAGEKATASTEKRLYKGEETFTVTASQTTAVKVVCKLTNAVAEVRFDDTVAENFDDFGVWVAAANNLNGKPAAGDPTALGFTADGKGYYIMPAGVTTFSWVFMEGDALIKKGSQANIKAGGKYIFTFRYSPDLPGFLECFQVTVDDSTENYDDRIIFTPDPTIVGVGFDMTQVQDCIPGRSGSRQYKITSMGELRTVTLTINGQTYDALASTPSILATAEDAYNLTLTVADSFFAGVPGGAQSLTFYIADADGGTLSAAAPCRVQGLLTGAAESCDLWSNTTTLRAMILDNPAAARFGLREAGGTWHEMTGTDLGGGIYSATFAPTWTEATNDAGLTVYTPAAGTGVFAGKNYEYRLTTDHNQYTGTFAAAAGQTIPGSDMEDGSMNCFNEGHGSFWDSGNNTYIGMKTVLCSQGTFAGMQGDKCAHLTARKPVAVVQLAAGNLFVGDFSMSGANGTVKFGKKYEWQARPKAMSVLVHATIGNVNANQHGSYIPTGSPDRGRIYVAIVDWSAQHDVKSGSGAPTGTWDPARATSTSEGRIIGYGSVNFEGTTAGSSMVPVTIPIQYYDKITKPGGNYTLVISCTTSFYGDYMNGCTLSVMYIDDFKWVY